MLSVLRKVPAAAASHAEAGRPRPSWDRRGAAAKRGLRRPAVAKFTILIHETAGDFAARTDPARQEPYWGAYQAYGAALAEGGVM